MKAAKREAEELGKRLVGVERRVVQMQHEIRRKEKEYERLQERWALVGWGGQAGGAQPVRSAASEERGQE